MSSGGFNSASLEIFEAAKELGKICILEQTILPRQLEDRILKEVAQNLPFSRDEKPETVFANPLSERERAEWNLADIIFVGSEFVRAGLIECGVSSDKIRVVPYGVDTSKFYSNETRKASSQLSLFFLLARSESGRGRMTL